MNVDINSNKDPNVVQALNYIKKEDFKSAEITLEDIKIKNKDQLNLLYYVKYKLEKFEEVTILNSSGGTDLYTKQLIGRL